MTYRRSDKQARENEVSCEFRDIINGNKEATSKVDTVKELHPSEPEKTESKLDYFKSLVAPGYIRPRELEKFLNGINVTDAECDFSYYKSHVRQNIYSVEDIKRITVAVRRACFKNHAVAQEAFKDRVTQEEKRKAYKALTNMSNFMLLITNALDNPVNISLRG